MKAINSIHLNLDSSINPQAHASLHQSINLISYHSLGLSFASCFGIGWA